MSRSTAHPVWRTAVVGGCLAVLAVLTAVIPRSGRGLTDPARAPSVQEAAAITGRFFCPDPDLANASITIGGKAVPDPSLVVDSETGGLENVVVWLGVKEWPHAGHSGELRFDEHELSPRVACVRAGESIRIRLTNPNKLSHVVLGRNQLYNPKPPIVPAAKELHVYVTKHPEPHPVLVGSQLCTWRMGWLVIRDYGQTVVTGPDGGFRFDRIPAGEHEIRFWHERIGFFRWYWDGGKRRPLPTSIRVESGVHDLGKIPVVRRMLSRFNAS